MLTEEKLLEYKEVFDLFQSDDILWGDRVAVALRSLGFTITVAEEQDMTIEIDMESNGMVDFKGFVNIVEKLDQAKDIDEELCQAFQAFDKQDNGYIATEELKKFMLTASCGSEADVDAMLAEADDGEGRVYLHAFKKLLQS